MCVHGRNVGGVIARGTAGGREPVVLFFAIDLVVHLTLAARLEVDNAHDPSASRDEHLLRLALFWATHHPHVGVFLFVFYMGRRRGIGKGWRRPM